jgi:hypothetical protein
LPAFVHTIMPPVIAAFDEQSY